jgi:transposase
MDDGQIKRRLFGCAASSREPARVLPDPATMHRELRGKGVILQLRWQEYREAHPEGYSHAQFCEHFHRFEIRPHPTLRQEYRAGEPMFVDYAGQTIPNHNETDRTTRIWSCPDSAEEDGASTAAR